VSLIKAVAAANRKTVVVLNSGAPVLMDEWLPGVPALVEAWYPGEEGGNAVADALFGDVNPSGKLPMTFLRRWEDAPAFGNYPGSGSVNYAEGIFVGYRHYDRKNLDVVFPFGHGLSYTSFAYAGLTVKPVKKVRPVAVTVSLEVRNTGARAGAEVVQLYVHAVAPGVERAPKELKGFQKVRLEPGESKRVAFTLDDRSLAYYDESTKQWVVEPGKYEILAGSSSRDIRARGILTID
jgi:beta-glucosidase